MKPKVKFGLTLVSQSAQMHLKSNLIVDIDFNDGFENFNGKLM
jgi:hypothetical protein